MSYKKFIADHKKRHAKINVAPALQPSPVPNKAADTQAASGQYAVFMDQCKADWHKLKAIPDHAERDLKKPAVLDEYRQFLTDWMVSGNQSQNDCLVINLILASDCKDWDWMMTLAAFAIKTNQVSILYNAEIQFKRDPMHIAADAVFIEAEKLFKSSTELSVALLNQNDDALTFQKIFNLVLSEEWVLNKSLTARYYKLAADFTTVKPGNEKTELEYLIIADALKNDIGVKGRIKDLQKLPDLQASAQA